MKQFSIFWILSSPESSRKASICAAENAFNTRQDTAHRGRYHEDTQANAV